MPNSNSAREERTVATLYEDVEVAESYIQKRFKHSWSHLLHDKQVLEVNHVLRTVQPESVLELAPGPARIATELQRVRKGVMVEASEAMLSLAKHRLIAAGRAETWDLRQGNAFELAPFHDQFDFVYTFRFIRHFHCDDRVRLYQGIAGCLRPGGLLMFDVVNQTMRRRLDQKSPDKAAGELDVYDETYSPETFYREMETYGFRVLRLTPVIAHFRMQSWVSHRFDHRIGAVCNVLVRLLEKIPSGEPLEWIALCQKSS